MHDHAHAAPTVLRRRCRRGAGDRAVRALFHPQRALVHRPGAARRWSRAAASPRSRSTACTVSSFSLAPDTAVGVTQHLGLSPRWLDHIPTGGASGVMCAAPRGARGAGRRCRHRRLRRRRHQPRRLVPARRSGSFSNFARDASYPYGSGGPNSIFAFITANYMRTFGATREDFGRIAVDQRTNALKNPNAMFKKPLTLDEYMGARPISDPIHLFDCVMPCAGAEAFLVMSEARARELGLAARAGPRRDRAPQRLCRRPGDGARRLARGPRRPLCAGRREARTTSTSSRPTTTTR